MLITYFIGFFYIFMLLCNYMKNFFKKFIVFLGIVAAVSTTFCSNTYARYDEPNTETSSSSECRYLLGMPAWDCGVGKFDDETTLVSNIAIIASNVLTDLTVVAAYLILGFVIYGGFQYMFSSGDPAKAANGKKTLTHAFIGLAIVISAYTIFSGVRIALIGDQSFGNCLPGSTSQCVDSNVMVSNLIQWIAGIAGVVAAIFLVVGAWGYMTAAGDPGKLQKAKSAILYSLIGLAIVALAEIITAFVSGLVRDANTSYLDNTTISININKESL